jgi:hypothetical protein
LLIYSGSGDGSFQFSFPDPCGPDRPAHKIKNARRNDATVKRDNTLENVHRLKEYSL